MNTYTIDIPNRFFVNARSPKEARDKVLERYKRINPDDLMGIRFTDQGGEITYLDAVDCCNKPVLCEDGACLTCGKGEK